MGGKWSRYRMAIGLFAAACGGSATAAVAVAPPPAAPVAPHASATPMAPPSANEEESNDPAGQVEARAGEFVPPSTKRGWLGVELEPAPDEGGVRIAKVIPR